MKIDLPRARVVSVPETPFLFLFLLSFSPFFFPFFLLTARTICSSYLSVRGLASTERLFLSSGRHSTTLSMCLEIFLFLSSSFSSSSHSCTPPWSNKRRRKNEQTNANERRRREKKNERANEKRREEKEVEL